MYIQQLITSGKTVFSVEDLRKIWQIDEKSYLRVVASRLFTQKKLLRVRRGLYALRDTYDIAELANKIKVPSYVSLETVLQKEGVVFQNYNSEVFSVSNNMVSKIVEGKTFRYSKIKNSILSNPLGILRMNQSVFASPERAVCDRIYLSPKYYFDNTRSLNREKLAAISKIYDNSRVEREVVEIIRSLNIL
jgi:hypothetical protein